MFMKTTANVLTKSKHKLTKIHKFYHTHHFRNKTNNKCKYVREKLSMSQPKFMSHCACLHRNTLFLCSRGCAGSVEHPFGGDQRFVAAERMESEIGLRLRTVGLPLRSQPGHEEQERRPDCRLLRHHSPS